MYVVEPINDVKKRKGDGEEHSGPLVYGIDVSQVGDFDFELRCAPADAPLAGHAVPLQGAPVALAAAHGLAVLDAGAVVGVHGGLGVAHARQHFGAAGLVPDFQGAEENVAVSVHLKGAAGTTGSARRQSLTLDPAWGSFICTCVCTCVYVSVDGGTGGAVLAASCWAPVFKCVILRQGLAKQLSLISSQPPE